MSSKPDSKEEADFYHNLYIKSFGKQQRIIDRLTARRDMNERNGNIERAMAYAVALADLREIFNE